METFFTLKLDISDTAINSIDEAVKAKFTDTEVLNGYKSEDTKNDVRAEKNVKLDSLPPVLIVSTKPFVHSSHGSQKNTKAIKISPTLELADSYLAPSCLDTSSLKQRSYILSSVVRHHGPDDKQGHYTSDIFSQVMHLHLYFILLVYLGFFIMVDL